MQNHGRRKKDHAEGGGSSFYSDNASTDNKAQKQSNGKGNMGASSPNG